MKKLEDRLSRMSGAGHRAGFPTLSPSGLASRPSGHADRHRPTDIRKLYAKMEYLARVGTGARGRSATDTARLAAACESGGRRITPLHMQLWSSRRRLHQPERRVLGVIDQIDPREEARHLRHRPRRRRRLAVRRPGPAQTGLHRAPRGQPQPAPRPADRWPKNWQHEAHRDRHEGTGDGVA